MAEHRPLISVNGQLREMTDSDSLIAAVAAKIFPVGGSICWRTSMPPTGWLIEDGSTIGNASSGATHAGEEYRALFNVLNPLGDFDAGHTVALADMRGRVPVGAGTGAGLTSRTLGSTFGAETHTLSESEMPSHTHDLLANSGVADSDLNIEGESIAAYDGAYGMDLSNDNAPDVVMHSESIGESGDDLPHNNMQPSLAVNFIIKY